MKQLQELGVPSPFLSGHTHSKLREVPDPLSWIRCFLLFMAARSDHPETRELAAYAVIIIDIAHFHGCFGWRRYDAVFLQQKAAGATLPWSEINASLMSNTVFAMLNGSQGLTCEFCFSSGHSKKDCTLYCLEQYSMSSSSAATPPHRSRARGRGNAAVSKDTICLRFNKGTCTGICQYTHACSSCYTVGHAEPDCPKGKASHRILSLLGGVRLGPLNLYVD